MKIRIVPAGIFNKKDDIHKFYKLVFLSLYLIVTLFYQVKIIEAESQGIKKANGPKIDDLKPGSGGVGTTVTINGSGFGTKYSDENKIIFGD